MSLAATSCVVCASSIDAVAGFCTACGYVASPDTNAGTIESASGDTLVRFATWGVSLTRTSQGATLTLTWSDAGAEHQRSRAALEALTALVDLGPVAPILDGATRIAVELPQGSLLTTALGSLAPLTRIRLLAGLAEFLEEARSSGSLWLDLAPDLVWLTDTRLIPLALWRTASVGTAPISAPWSSACSPPECALGGPPTSASQTNAWAKLARLMLPFDEQPTAWRPIIAQCLRDDPLERVQDFGDLLGELQRATAGSPSLAQPVMARGVKVAGASDRGPMRHEQDDRWAARCSPDGARGVAAVADGMGGGVLGGLAAEWALEAVMGALESDVEPLDLPGRVEALVQETNRRVHRFREGLSLVEPMGTTLTALVWAGKDRHVFQVGDSRAYRASNEEYVQQSRDHVLASPTASSIPGGVTNAIDGGTLHVDVTTLAAASPVERWLLSSDGFWSPAHALNVLPRPPESAGRDPVQLLDLVRRGEAERLDLLRDADNATVVLVELQHPGNVSEEAS